MSPLCTPPIPPTGHDGDDAEGVLGAPASAAQGRMTRVAGQATVVHGAVEQLQQQRREPGNIVAGRLI